MATALEMLLDELGHRLDDELLPRLYAAIGLSTAEVRAELAELGLPFHDPVTGRTPAAHELEEAARTLISRSSRTAAAGGAVSAFTGLIGVPPELAAALVQTLRLGQRLAVLYGVDPDTDRGRLILWRAVAAALELELPKQGALDLRVRALPSLIRASLPDASRSLPELGRMLVSRAAVALGRRGLRVLPGMGAALGAYDGRKRVRQQGERMLYVFQRAFDGVPLLEGPVEDAVEIRG